MGTNYYLYQKSDCVCCKRPYQPLHIGKSSGGWYFSLHVIPEDNINDLDDWRELWSKEGAVIRSEYDEPVSVAEMENIITERSWPKRTDFDYLRNSAEPGEFNLVRHRIDGGHCIKHGEGTWDCILGEFS